MPKKRGKKKQKFEKRLFIVCEGAKNKSEDAYLSGFINTCKMPTTVEVKVVDTKKNTGKELVKIANSLKELDNDQVWVVYDKDGYSKHPDTFENARIKNVNIAFSAISFEIWVLLHFKYTTKNFLKSDDVISYMKSNSIFEYSKNKVGMYHEIIKAGGSVDLAIKHAKQLQAHQQTSNTSPAVMATLR